MVDWKRLNADLASGDQRAGKNRDLARDLQMTADVTIAGGFMATRSPIEDAAGTSILATGDRIGNWRIKEPIGEGGMGAVYLVDRDDGQFNQRAALKLVKAPMASLRERFVAERDRLAGLEHPGISRLIDGGRTEDDLPFMVVEYVRGQPIDKHAKVHALDNRSRVQLIRSLIDGVAYAHRNLVLHRDIKPANVLVDEEGHVRLIDFGVAALLDDDGDGTPSPLTLAYAAPESVESSRPTIALDIFSVGMLMHELLTGHLPSRDTDGGVAIDERVIPDSDLRSIVMQATAKRPEDRYSSIDALGDDLDAWLAHKPVEARNGGASYRAIKMIERNPVASILSAGVLLALIGGIVATSIMANRANTARDRAEYALQEAELNFRVQEAYGDALLRMFAGEGNTEKMTQVLLERWNEALEHADDDPQHAAEITYAVGRNFVERNDYRRAIEVLTPWIEKGFGDPRLVTRGKLNLGLAHRYQGSYDEAVPLLQEVVSDYENSPEEGSFNHVLALMMLSGASGDQQAMRDAESYAEAAMSRPSTVEEKIFFLNVQSLVASSRRDHAAAADHNTQIVQLIDDNPLTEIAGQDVVRINKAMYDAYYRQDFDAAERELRIAEDLLTEDKGESISLAYIYDILAVIAAERGEFEKAIELSDRAIDMALKHGGEGSDIHGYTGASRLEILIAAGRTDEAMAETERLSRIMAEKFQGLHVRFTLAKALVLGRTENVEAATNYLSTEGLTGARASGNINALFRYNRLVDLGVSFPEQASSP